MRQEINNVAVELNVCHKMQRIRKVRSGFSEGLRFRCNDDAFAYCCQENNVRVGNKVVLIVKLVML